MTNHKLKFVKSAAALALGASVITTAVVAGDTTASAKTTYKVSNGKLVNAKTKKAIKGYKSYKSVLYKDGKKFTGLYSNRYYKNGVKATGTYKNTYYVKGVKKVTTGTYAGAYYVNGVKKVTTGTYAGAYYVNGVKKVTTGTYNNAYYVKGVKKVTTGTYNKAYYVKGKKAVATGLYQSKYYVDGVLNVGLALFEGKLYDGAEQNKGLKEFKGKTYFNADLANDTYKDANGVEKAYENGVEVGAKVKSVEAINGAQIKVTFNKSIDEDTISNITVAPVGGSAISSGLTLKLSEDKKSVVITNATAFTTGEYTVKVTDSVKTTAGDKVEASTKLIKVEDKVAPTYVGFTKENASTFLFNFSEPINDLGSVVVKKADGTVIPTTDATVTKDGSTIKIVLSSNVEAGKDITVSFAGQTDFATNILETPFTVTVQKGAKDGVAPEVTSVTPVNAKKFEIKFSEEVQGFTAADLTVAGSSVKSVTQDKTDKTKYIVELNSAVSGLTNVSVTDKSYADLTGEEGKAFSQIVNFAADTVKPTATAAISVNKDGNQVLTFTTSEDTTLAATTGTITLPAKAVKNFVTTTGDITFNSSDLKPVTGSSTQYTVELSKVKFAGASLVKDTTYTVDLAANVFADVAGNKNEAKTAAFSFTRGADKDASKPVLTAANVNVLDNDTFTVDFGTTVELDNSTVVNKGNYYVAGAQIDSVSLNANGVATVKLVSGSNNNTGNRTVKVTGVKATNGNVMDDFTTTKSFNENVKPTVQSAKVSKIDKASSAVVAKDGQATVAGTTKVVATNAAAATSTTATTTYTVNAAGDKVSDGTNEFALTTGNGTITQGGVTFTATGLAANETFTIATVAGEPAKNADAGKTTIKVTLSEEVNALATDYVVNVDGKKVDGVKATVTATTAKSKEVTIVIDKELTADDFAKGVTLTSDDYKLTDEAGNKADISAAGIKVSL
ncbi:Ig-like domain-containing protein [Rummeliibacillus pycnus]|uniref:Ig-like domain-containing protein n=1 Tax=Rummeliibacillus pycnus TaxID=101070 RepID=UPI0037C8EA2A